jgi:hypothetical protein
MGADDEDYEDFGARQCVMKFARGVEVVIEEVLTTHTNGKLHASMTRSSFSRNIFKQGALLYFNHHAPNSEFCGCWAGGWDFPRFLPPLQCGDFGYVPRWPLSRSVLHFSSLLFCLLSAICCLLSAICCLLSPASLCSVIDDTLSEPRAPSRRASRRNGEK